MSEVAFQVVGSAPARYAAAPALNLRLRLEDPGGRPVESIVLRCQIRIEPQRRRYTAEEEQRLLELFGETPRWGDTLKPFLWTHVSHMVPAFTGSTEIELPVPCTYDMEIAAAKYFHALEGGEIPLILLFSGTVFARGEAGLTVTQIPWNREAVHRLPVAVWREVMDLYFPGGGWMRLRRETLDALMAFKARRALGSWDDVIGALMDSAAPGADPGEDRGEDRGAMAVPAPSGPSPSGAQRRDP